MTAADERDYAEEAWQARERSYEQVAAAAGDDEQLRQVAALARNDIGQTIDLTGRGFALTETDTGHKPTTGDDVRVQMAIVTRPTGEAFVQLALMSLDGQQLYGGAQIDLADVQNAIMAAMAGTGPLGGM